MPFILSDILGRLRGNGKKPATAAAIADALSKIDVAGLAEAALAAEVARREAVLVGKPEVEIERLEVAMLRARMESERAQIATDALRVQLAEAQEREEGERLASDLAAIKAEAEAAGAALAHDYEKAAAVIAKALTSAEEIGERVKGLNARLRAAGHHDALVAGPVEIAFPPIGMHVSRPDPAASISLPPLGRFRGLGEARDRYLLLGLLPAAEAAE